MKVKVLLGGLGRFSPGGTVVPVRPDCLLHPDDVVVQLGELVCGRETEDHFRRYKDVEVMENEESMSVYIM